MNDWSKRQFDLDDATEEDVVLTYETGWRIANSIRFLITTALLLGFFIGLWQMWKTHLAKSDAQLKQQVQAVLNLEHIAALNGNGELFLGFQANDPAWISAQLWPENQAAMLAGMTVTQAEQYEDFIQADVAWTANGETWQRIAFFEERDGRLHHTPTPSDYWDYPLRDKHPWGTLIYAEVDSDWAEDVAAFVSKTIADTCAANCLTDRLPFTLVLAGDYGLTAAPRQLRLPSPLLLALDEHDAPAPLFWHKLQQQLEGYLTPTAIRFAVPPLPNRSGLPIIDYEQAAARFMVAHPDITIELVNLEALPDDPAILAAEFDGAAIPPTQAMLTAGLVRDLTDFMNTDPDFDQADFYEQIWQGAVWQKRIWWMPQAANMRLLFYDKAAYRLANRPEPSLRWTWTEMGQDVAALVSAQPEKDDLSWGFMDTSLDTIFSYAYNWHNHCTEKAAILCQNQLQTQNVAAALNWYSQMVGQPEQMPDFSRLTPVKRDSILRNWQGARRQAVIWADLPVHYEFRHLLDPLGVVPFPGSDKFDGITPLWVYGSFISQQSERPLAMWQWLKFLSYQRPTSRLIPARPSVATGMNYWTTLPPHLDDAMRVAFPFARPVTPEEQTYLSWAQVEAVLSGELSPIEAAQQQSGNAWFGQDQESR